VEQNSTAVRKFLAQEDSSVNHPSTNASYSTTTTSEECSMYHQLVHDHILSCKSGVTVDPESMTNTSVSRGKIQFLNYKIGAKDFYQFL
jgi:hypothetical protein